MGAGDLPLFDLLDRRLAWLTERQSVLAQNVANADTPGFAARDVAPFTAMLTSAMHPTSTNPMHMAGGGATAASRPTRGERAPDGNGVRLDEQLTRIADTDTAHELVSGLYRKYMGLFRTALGR